MITNDQLLKLFVLVPSTVKNFNGATVSGAANEHRIFFEEATGKLWAKGIAFGGGDDNTELANTVATLIGEDTDKSIREIAAAVLNEALEASPDADTTINNLKEILDWFKNLPEDEAGALALVNAVGKPAVPGQDAVLYADETEYNEAKGTSLTAEQFAELSDEEKTKTPAVAPVAATGLYKVIEDSIAAIDLSDYATKTHVEDRLGDLGNATEAEGNTPAVPHTVKSYVDTKIGNLGNKVEAQEAVLYTAEDDEVIAGKKQVGDVKTPAVTAVPYTSVMEVVTDNELVTAAAINDLSDRVDALEEFNPWETYVAPAPEEP